MCKFMRHTLSTVLLIAICMTLLAAAGCSNTPVQSNEQDTTATPILITPEKTIATTSPTVIPVVSEAQKLEEYKAFLAKLGKKPDEARAALDALLALDAPLPDEAIDSYLSFMERLCSDLDMTDVVGGTSFYSDQSRAECARYLMRLDTSEGFEWTVPDIAAIGVCLYGKTSAAYEAYFGLAMLERQQGIAMLVNDGILNMSWLRLADYIGGRQAFCDAYPNFSQTEKMRVGVDRAVIWYEGTNPLPHSLPFSKKGLRAEVRESYEYFLETYVALEGSAAYERVVHIEQLWRENGDKLTDAVKGFLQLDEGFYRNP